jgi:hypothetical protein
VKSARLFHGPGRRKMPSMPDAALLPTTRRALLAASLLLLAACQVPRGNKVVPLPRLPAGPIDLRVAYLVNDRLPRMSPAQLGVLLAATQQAAKEHLGVELRFAALVEIPIAQAFAAIPAARREAALKDTFDFKTGKGDRARLDKAYAQEFAQGQGPLPELIAYAQPYAPGLRADSTATEFGAAMAALQLQRLQGWRATRALDGGPAIEDGNEFNSYPMWVALGYSRLPYELVLTNQLIASIEYVDPEVHSAVRGGYANGLTTYSQEARFGTMSVWSTYGFTGNDKDLLQWRNGERYEPLEAARLAGLSATHEIGHQLFHFLHPYARPACIMDPVPMFAYRAWAKGLSARDCPAGSDPALVPGAYRFLY